jgi:aryl-alcohol dehydrogenase-like predicted oxidoreductase
LDDQVKSGKLRYVGISDAPPWKVAPAQMMAHFHGWNPLIALQIEYSLPGMGSSRPGSPSAFQYRETPM